MGSQGRVDFYIPDVGWAVELMRDGEHMDEHIARFLPNGRYYGALVARRVTACILLDFRQSIPRAARRELQFPAIFAMFTVFVILVSRKKIYKRSTPLLLCCLDPTLPLQVYFY
jgi:hypothetical protein